jgi:predicted nucleotidyltransferase
VRGKAQIDRVVARLTEDGRVLAVYVFGSRARGEEGPLSDVDLGVLLSESVDLSEELRLRAAVVEELRSDAVDLVVLNHAPPMVRYEVVTTGRPLFARDSSQLDAFEERVALEYFDTAHLREVQRAIAREAVD